MRHGDYQHEEGGPTPRFFVTSAFLRIKSLLRTPLNGLLFLLVPVVLVQGFGFAWQHIPDVIATRTATNAGYLIGGAFGTGFVAGVFTFVQVYSSLTADRRLLGLGLPSWQLLVAYATMMVGISAAIACYTLVVLTTVTPVESPVRAFGALFAGGFLYALIGVLVGLVVDRLFEGSLVVLFVADMDAFLGSSLSAVDSVGWFLPLYYPRQLLGSAVVDGHLEPVDVLGAVGYAVVLLTLVGVVLWRKA